MNTLRPMGRFMRLYQTAQRPRGARVIAPGFPPLIRASTPHSGRMADRRGLLEAMLVIFLNAANRAYCPPAQQYLERRFGELKPEEESFFHVGAGLSQESDISAAATQKVSTNGLECLPTSPTAWTDRPCPLSIAEARSCHCKLGQ